MSVSYNKRKKARARAKSDEYRSIISAIRNGKWPRYFFMKDGEGTDRLQREKMTGRFKRKLTWAMGSTFKALAGLSKDSK